MPNHLVNETSPYLLQHAANPVDWYPWGTEALELAERENKLILVSVGYSSCHWCHVMAHESFEDPSVADLMNKHFVCIKVDREERPDIDQIYMLAVQLMTGQGGWPLHCICLPDQRPIYGGTYFRKDDWKNLLQELAQFWELHPEEASEYASRLVGGIRDTEKLNLSEQSQNYSSDDLNNFFNRWKPTFDLREGGFKRAPKFPLPNNWQFILRYAHLVDDSTAREALRVTLIKIASGGIYDHLGGGFARYSVDAHWHIPHFEKMLYDNAQLVSLYSEAYQYERDERYREVVFQTIQWLRREMRSPENGFFSALDADSEGVEGRFYTWTIEELKAILTPGELSAFSAYFNVSARGNWEEEQTNVLKRHDEEQIIAERLHLPLSSFRELLGSARQKVFNAREKRIRPGLDHKIVASWNGLMLKGLTDAYRAFGTQEFLELALANANFIVRELMDPSGRLKRLYRPPGSPGLFPSQAFLDDYAFITEAFIGLYEVTFNEQWLSQALLLVEYALRNFYDAGTGMFYYTSQHDKELIARKHEITDNVIPSSNSAMALNLFKLGHFYEREDYLDQADVMLRNVFPLMNTYPSGYSNWAILLLYKTLGIYEIAITGEHAEQKRRELEKTFIPDKILLGGRSGTLPLLADKWGAGTRIFVCKNRTCRLPVTEVAEALKQIVKHHG